MHRNSCTHMHIQRQKSKEPWLNQIYPRCKSLGKKSAAKYLHWARFPLMATASASSSLGDSCPQPWALATLPRLNDHLFIHLLEKDGQEWLRRESAMEKPVSVWTAREKWRGQTKATPLELRPRGSGGGSKQGLCQSHQLREGSGSQGENQPDLLQHKTNWQRQQLPAFSPSQAVPLMRGTDI